MLRLSLEFDLKADVFPLIPREELGLSDDSDDEPDSPLGPGSGTFMKLNADTIDLRIVGETASGQLIICREGIVGETASGQLIICPEGIRKNPVPKQRTFIDLYDTNTHTLKPLYLHSKSRVNICNASVDSSLSLLAFTVSRIAVVQRKSKSRSATSINDKKDSDKKPKSRVEYSSYLVKIKERGIGEIFEMGETAYKIQFVEFVTREVQKKKRASYLFFHQKRIFKYSISLEDGPSKPKFLRIVGHNPDERYLWCHWDRENCHLYVLTRKDKNNLTKRPMPQTSSTNRTHLEDSMDVFTNEEVSETLCLFACHAVTETSETLLYEIPISIKLWNQFSYRRGGSPSPSPSPSPSSSSSSSSPANISIRGLNGAYSTLTSFPPMSSSPTSSSDPTNTTNATTTTTTTTTTTPTTPTPNAKSMGGVDGYGNGRAEMRKEAMEAHQGPFPLNPFRKYRRIMPLENDLFHLVELKSGAICLCQQYLSRLSYPAIDVSIYLLIHKGRLDLSIPMNNVPIEEVANTRVHFNTICDMLIIFIPGHFLHILDCGVNHRPMLGPTVGRNLTPQLPDQKRVDRVWIKPIFKTNPSLGNPKDPLGYIMDCNTGIAYKFKFNREAILRMFLSRPSTVQLQIVHLAIVHLQDEELANEMFDRMCKQSPQNFVIPLQREYVIAASYLAIRKAPPCVLSQIQITTIEDLQEPDPTIKKRQKTSPFRHSYHDLAGYQVIRSVIVGENVTKKEFFIFKKSVDTQKTEIMTKSYPLWETMSSPQVIHQGASIRTFIGRIVDSFVSTPSSPEEQKSPLSGVDINSSDFSDQVDNMELVQELAMQIVPLYPRDYKNAYRDAMYYSKEYRIAQNYSMASLYNYLLRGTECDKSLVFQAYESYLCVSEEMRLPLPQEFHQHFASIGILCLPQSLFLQYVNRGVIRVTAAFITDVISLLLPPLPPSSSPPPSVPSPSSSSSPAPSPSEEEEGEREEEEEEEEENYLDNFSPLKAHSIFTCSDPNCNPHLVSQGLKYSDRLFLYSLISQLGDVDQYNLFRRHCPCLRLVAENIGYRFGGSRGLETNQNDMDDQCLNAMFLPMSAYIRVIRAQRLAWRQDCEVMETYLRSRYQGIFNLEDIEEEEEEKIGKLPPSDPLEIPFSNPSSSIPPTSSPNVDFFVQMLHRQTYG